MKRTAPRMPGGAELKRLEALCALAKAHARAKQAGALDASPSRARNPRPPRRQTDEDTRKNMERRIELMIELEVRWRMGELGVPYTEKLGERFKPFRFDSDHRRKLEQLNNLVEVEGLRTRGMRASAAKP